MMADTQPGVVVAVIVTNATILTTTSVSLLWTRILDLYAAAHFIGID